MCIKLSQVIVILIEMALDHKASHRELSSEFLAEAYNRIFTPKDYTKGNNACRSKCSELKILELFLCITCRI
jgi:hypothetical protein